MSVYREQGLLGGIGHVEPEGVQPRLVGPHLARRRAVESLRALRQRVDVAVRGGQGPER